MSATSTVLRDVWHRVVAAQSRQSRSRFGIEKTKSPADEKYYILLRFTGISRLP